MPKASKAELLAGSELVGKPHVLEASEKGLGSQAYSDKTLAPLLMQTRVKKQDSSLNTWSDTAIVLALRAKRAAQTYGKKDFNALYRLVLSAGIAYDKAFPQVQVPTGGSLIVQLFGSLGSEVTRAILEPQHPSLVIDVTPQPEELADKASGSSQLRDENKV